jgi:AraC family transcriptional regulator, transcriptional activator of pobA
MMRKFQPILFENLTIQIEQYGLKRVALNRHIREVEQVDIHAHEHHQFLVYLKGGGTQTIEANQRYPVERGDVIFLQQGKAHSFQKKDSLRPLCLALDFDHPSIELRPIHRLPARDLSRLEQGLIRLGQLNDACSDSLSKAVILVEVLQILVSNLKQDVQVRVGSLESKVISAMEMLTPNDWTPCLVARQMNSDVEGLSRQLQAEGSQALGKTIANQRLKKAKQLLLTDLPAGFVAETIGVFDQNYFSRWFKKQTGYSPSDFRSREKLHGFGS